MALEFNPLFQVSAPYPHARQTFEKQMLHTWGMPPQQPAPAPVAPPTAASLAMARAPKLPITYFSGKVKEIDSEKGGKVIVYRQYNASNTACPLSTWHTLVKPKAQAYHQRNAEVLEKYIQGTGEYYQDVSWVKHKKAVGEVPYVVFDTETTGISAFDRIVQIAATQVDKNHVVRHMAEFNKLINPGIPIKPGASAIHGITDEKVKDAPHLEDILYDFCKDVLGETGLVVAYNAQFDVGMPNKDLINRYNYNSGAMLNRAIDRWNTSKHAKETGRLRSFDPALVVDPFVLIQRIHPFVSLGKKLTHHYEILMGKPLTNAHDAQADVDATVNLLKYIFKYLQKHSIPVEWAKFVEEKFLPEQNPDTNEAWKPEEKAAYIAHFIRNNREKFEHSPKFKDVERKTLNMVDVLTFQHGGVLYHDGKPGLPRLDLSLNMFGWDGDKQWDGTDIMDPGVADEVRKEQDNDNRRMLLHKFRDDLQSPAVTEVATKLQDVLAPAATEDASAPKAAAQKGPLAIRREMLEGVGQLVTDKFLKKTLPILNEAEPGYNPAAIEDLKSDIKKQFNAYLESKFVGTAPPKEFMDEWNDRFAPRLTEEAFQHLSGTLYPEFGKRSLYTYVAMDPTKPLMDPEVLKAVRDGIKKSQKTMTKMIASGPESNLINKTPEVQDDMPITIGDSKVGRGLIVKQPWVDLILDGRKTWEIRGQAVPRALVGQTIGLIESGSGQIIGTAVVAGDEGPLDNEGLVANVDKHQIKMSHDDVRTKGMPYGNRTYAWVLKDVKRLEKPIPYKHPQGAIIWVKLSKNNTGENA